MWIKICGNTNLEDAQRAVDLGADALGFIFAPSKRRVTPEQVGAITPHLTPGIERVGVFQGQTSAEIIEIVQVAGLTAIQLHDVVANATSVEAHTDFGCLATRVHEVFGDRVRLIQSLHWTVDARASGDQVISISRQLASLSSIPFVDRVLIDSSVGSTTGGTGVPFDWKAARSALRNLAPHLHLILAGGLDSGNVKEAIRTLQPWGVDAVSGVEATAGRKDAKKLAAFINNARA